MDLSREFQHFSSEESFLLKLSFQWKMLLWFLVTTSLIIGWICKSLIFSHIFKTKISEQPINILICAEQFVHLCCSSFILFNLTLTIPSNLSIGQFVDKYTGVYVSSNTYCSTYFYLSVLNGAYRVVNGLAMAIVRFLYIKKGNWVRVCPNLLISAGCLTVITTLLLINLFRLENVSNRSLFNNCMGHNQVFQVYTISVGKLFLIFYVKIKLRLADMEIPGRNSPKLKICYNL